MAVSAAFANQCKQDLLSVIAGHTCKCALYTQAAASLGKDTTLYTTSGELPTAGGYTRGGVELTGASVGITGDTAYIDWADPSWASASFTADAAMIYDTSNSNHVVATLVFTSATSTNGTWTLQLPAPGVAATVRIS